MGRVFVVQDQQRMNSQTGQLEPRFDLSVAKEYGELNFLLSSSTKPFSTEGVINALKEKLRTYSDKDYLLLIGNPCLIGLTVAVASQVNEGRVRMLQWHGRDRRYIPVHAVLF